MKRDHVDWSIPKNDGSLLAAISCEAGRSVFENLRAKRVCDRFAGLNERYADRSKLVCRAFAGASSDGGVSAGVGLFSSTDDPLPDSDDDFGLSVL